MKKSVNKIYLVLILVIFLFLIACGGRIDAGEEPIDTAAALAMVQTGTEGVETRILPNQPPAIFMTKMNWLLW